MLLFAPLFLGLGTFGGWLYSSATDDDSWVPSWLKWAAVLLIVLGVLSVTVVALARTPLASGTGVVAKGLETQSSMVLGLVELVISLPLRTFEAVGGLFLGRK